MQSTSDDPGLATLLAELTRDADAIARRVAQDVGVFEAATVRATVARLLRALAAGPRISGAEVHRLREEGGDAARRGEPLQALLDRYLSAGWVVWGYAVDSLDGRDPGALTRLGGALLRAGDDIAAALAAGYTSAERSLAARAGATRRAVLDELLEAAQAGPTATGRAERRAALVGLDPEARYTLVLVAAEREIEDEGPVIEVITRILARAPARQRSFAAVRSGDLVVLLEHPWRSPAVYEEAVASLDGLGRWWAVSTDPVALRDASAAHAAALDALAVVRRLSRDRSIVPVRTVALERALRAAPALLEDAIELWLGPLQRGGRGSAALLPTLEAFFAAGESVAAAARLLRVAPRTVSYRLARSARLLGVPALDPETRLRLATALLARRLTGR